MRTLTGRIAAVARPVPCGWTTEAAGEALAEGNDPDEIARRVVEAVRSGRFHVPTHPGHVSAVRVRAHTIAWSEPLV